MYIKTYVISYLTFRENIRFSSVKEELDTIFLYALILIILRRKLNIQEKIDHFPSKLIKHRMC